MPDKQSGAERASRISGCGLDPKFFKWPLAQQLPVCDAVQRDAAGQHEVLLSGDTMRLASHVQENLFGHDLHAGGEVHVTLLQWRFRRAWRTAEQFIETFVGHR